MRQFKLLVLFVALPFIVLAQQEVFLKDNVAIQGYDPVAYFKEGKPVLGKAENNFVWKDAQWQFSSEENLKAFQAAPEKFAPQYGGFCAYGMSNGYKAPTSPDAWTIVDGKLYLNYNNNVKARWNEKQSEYIDKANKNWPEVKGKKE